MASMSVNRKGLLFWQTAEVFVEDTIVEVFTGWGAYEKAVVHMHALLNANHYGPAEWKEPTGYNVFKRSGLLSLREFETPEQAEAWLHADKENGANHDEAVIRENTFPFLAVSYWKRDYSTRMKLWVRTTN